MEHLLDFDRLNRWLTLIANFGVLVGLLLLVFEIRQNSDVMQAQMAQARADNRIEKYRDQVHSAYWPAIGIKRDAAKSPEEWIDSLTPEEHQRVRSHLLLELNDLRNQYYQHQKGYLDQTMFDTSTESQAMGLMQIITYMGDLRPSDPEFVEYLNSIARKYNLPIYDSTKK